MSVYGSQIIGGYWTISKTLAKYFKCIHTVMILDELIFHESKHGNSEGWFFYQVELLQERCFVGERVRKRCLQRLVDEGILKIEKRGVPAKYWYLLNLEKVDSIIKSVGTSDLQMSGTGDLQMSGTGDLQMSGTIIKKETKKLKEEVIVGDSEASLTANATATADFIELKKHIGEHPYYKRLKAIGSITKVFGYYGNLNAFKSNYEALYASYCRKKRFPGDDGPLDEKWYHDCYECVENKMLKEIRS